MRYSYLILLLLALSLLPHLPTVAAADEALLFVKTYGSSNDDFGYSTATDASGDIYVAGIYNATDIDTGGDAILLKYDPSGNLLWARTWETTGTDRGIDMAVDLSSGSIYLTGSTNGLGAGDRDVLLLKFYPSGALDWQRVWGGADREEGVGVKVDSAGNIYLTGSTASFGAGGDDIFLLRFNSSGNLDWQVTWGGSGEESAGRLALSDGDIYVAAGSDSFGAGGDAVLLKFSSSGALLWTRTWGGTSFEYATGVTADSSGNIYTTGYVESFGAGNFDAFILKFNSTGSLLIQKTWGTDGWDGGIGLSTDPSGNLYMSGFYNATVIAFMGGQVALLKLTPAGNLLYALTWGGQNNETDVSVGMEVDSDGNAYVTGFVYQPPYSLDTGNMTLGTPSYTAGTSSNSTLGTPSYTPLTPNISAQPAFGSETYAGAQDLFLFKYGLSTESVGCQSGLCTIQSNSTLIEATYNASSNTLSFTASGATGTTGYANVTVPRDRVSDINDVKVYVNDSETPFSYVSNATHYFLYFTFTFQSEVIVNITLGVVVVDLPPYLPLVIPLLTLPLVYGRKSTSRRRISDSH